MKIYTKYELATTLTHLAIPAGLMTYTSLQTGFTIPTFIAGMMSSVFCFNALRSRLNKFSLTRSNAQMFIGTDRKLRPKMCDVNEDIQQLTDKFNCKPAIVIQNHEMCFSPNALVHSNEFSTVIEINRSALKRLNRDEIKSVMGHELGHIKAGHNLVNHTLSAIWAGNICVQAISVLNNDTSLLWMYASMAAFFTQSKLLSQLQEYQADRIGAEMTDPKHLTRAFEKMLFRQMLDNKKYPSTVPFFQRFSHPPMPKRIKRLSRLMS